MTGSIDPAATSWLGYARTGREFEVMDELDRIGVAHWRGERIEFRRLGRNRTAEPYTLPALHNYVWMRFRPEMLMAVHAVPYLAPTMLALTAASVAALEAFRLKAEERLADAKECAGRREAISGYQQGDVLEIRDGALVGLLARFERLVKAASDPWPRVEATVSILGREAVTTFDPLAVRRAR